MRRVRHGMRAALVAFMIAFGVIATPQTGHALFHLMSLTEIFGGTSTDPDAQFIEMQMYADDQRFLTGHEVAVFDASGEEVAAFTFAEPAANGANQSHILLATEQAQSAFDVEADLTITPAISSAGGKACFRSVDGAVIDCASWGNYSGDAADTGTPFNTPIGLLPGQSMERVTSGGSDEDALDAEDDTNNSEADFDLAAPTPTNNAGSGPQIAEHGRSIMLSLKGALVASGKIGVEDGTQSCADNVAVKVQRKRDGRWRTVGSTDTDGDGSYRVRLRDRRGRYRAVAPETSPSEEDRCLKAISPTRRNR